MSETDKLLRLVRWGLITIAAAVALFALLVVTGYVMDATVYR